MAVAFSSSQLWRAVDAQQERLAYVEFLDQMRQHLRDYKQATYQLLGLGPGQRVLDVGCGPGGDLLDLAARVAPGGVAVGVDASATMVAEARRRAVAAGLDGAVQAEQADAAALPFADGSFQAARSERVVQHLPNPQAVLQEMVRVTAPGGMVMVSDPDWSSAFFTGGDQRVGSAVVRRLAATVQNPQLARDYHEQLLAAGLTAVGSVVRGEQHRFRTMSRRHNLGDLLAEAVSAGEVDAAAARRWLAEQEQLDDAGAAFFVLVDFTAWGRKA